MVAFAFSASQLRAFEKAFPAADEDAAIKDRGDFIQAFPIESLVDLTVDTYAIGNKTPTFCAYVEARTTSWAAIQGATAFKFGVYFGKTKSDKTQKFRHAERYGSTTSEAFETVKAAILTLVAEAARVNPQFSTIDHLQLSPMFRAKILSLYFPDKFINICSPDHLRAIASAMHLPEGRPLSEYQSLILDAKYSTKAMHGWSNPKYMNFLYDKFIRTKRKYGDKPLRKGRRPPIVDIEALLEARRKRGLAAEQFAMNWDAIRLAGLNLENPNDRIIDVRDRPGYGYDFETIDNDRLTKRFVEVKSILRLGKSYRFFLSGHERKIALSTAKGARYHFYLVSFDSNAAPTKVTCLRAEELFLRANVNPDGYVVTLEMPHES